MLSESVLWQHGIHFKHLYRFSFEIVKPRQVMSVYQITMRGAERDLNTENNCRRVYARVKQIFTPVYVGLWEGGVTLASVSCKPGASIMQQITVVTNKRIAYLKINCSTQMTVYRQ